ncbi:MAG: branched-chain amino acid ABC transporter substrate-binding protein [Deltaproteobacteria bacterium]|nr:branched-chain amino acid ABC transporter substrate-binding protein [Deltaproteobacteria bacterium]
MVRFRWFQWLVMACACVGAVSASAADEWGEIVIPDGKPIKIGLGAMLSGGYATLGIDIRNAVEMAVGEKGRILGHLLDLQAEDDQCEGAPSVAIAEKFCNDPLVAGVVGYMCSGGSIPASDIHNKYKLVMISPSSTSLELTNRGIPVFFRTCWNDKIQGEAGAVYALKKNWTQVAVLHDKSAYGQGLADEFKRHILGSGGKVLAHEGLTRGDKDFTPVLTVIKPLNPQLVYFGGMAAEGALLVRQMRRAGIKAKFMSDDGCYTEKDFIQGAGKASRGAYVTYAKTPEAERFSSWVKRFEAKYGPRQTFSPQSYDATNILMAAIERTARKGEDGRLIIGKKALRDAVASTEYDGVTGRVAFDEYGDRSGSVVAVNVVACEKGACFFKEVED